VTTQYRAYWHLPHDYATSRVSANFQKQDAASEEEAMRLVENQGDGFIEVLDDGTVVRKMYLEDDQWRTEHATDNQTHQKIDIAEYE
jgi:hypothetical protein